jgi:polyhydroxyalkanoate synthesis repressor PhaR
MPTPKVIKRYANRKLYDTQRSCYVTLDDISMMITAGDEVRVMDNKSGDDLTSVTLAQIILESEKQQQFMPLGLLRDLIRNKGSEVQAIYRDRRDQVHGAASTFRESAKGSVQAIKGRAERLTEQVGDVMKIGEDGAHEQITTAHSLLNRTQEAFDELQSRFGEKVKGGMGLLEREFKQLRDRLSELEARLGNTEQD